MVDLMSVEGGPGGGASPAKLIGGLIAFICVLLAIVALVVAFTLPSTISCHVDDTKYYVKLVDKPVVTSVEPKYICLAQQARPVTLTGTGFYSYGTNPPVVSIGDNVTAEVVELTGTSTPFDVWRQDVKVYTTVVARLKLNVSSIAKQKIVFRQPVPEVSSAHFASQVPIYAEQGCTADNSELIVLPPPVVTSVQPRVMCLGSKQKVIIGGRDFVFFAGGDSAPAATTTTTTAAAATTAAPSTDATTAAPGRKRQGVNDTTSTAAATDSATTTSVASTAGGPATLATAGPDKFGGAGSATLGGEPTTFSNLKGTSCTPSSLNDQLKLCTQATLEIDVSASKAAADSLSPFVLTNPDPVGCSSERFDVPVLERARIEALTPYVFFTADVAQPGNITGKGFLRYDGAVPRVRFQVAPTRDMPKTDDASVPVGATVLVEATNVTASGCKAVAGVSGVETCTVLEFIMPPGFVAPTKSDTDSTPVTVDVIVTQPEPLDALCGASVETALLAAPKFTDNTDFVSCTSSSAGFTVTGIFYRFDSADPKFLFNDVVVEETGLKSLPVGGKQVNVGKRIITQFDTLELKAPKGLMFGITASASLPNVTIDITGQDKSLTVPGLKPVQQRFAFIPNMQTQVPPFPGLCATSGNETIDFKGEWFIFATGGRTPRVEIAGEVVNFKVTPTGCSGLTLTPKFTGLQKCTGLSVSVPFNYTGQLTLRSPPPFSLSCSLDLDEPLQQVPKATLTSIAEPSVCIGSANQKLTLTGAFPQIGQALPNVALNGVAFGGATCAMSANATLCNKLEVVLDPNIAAANAATIGFSNINITVRVATCVSTGVTTVVGLPTGSITSVTPSRVCGTRQANLAIAGSSLLQNAVVELAFAAAGSNLAMAPRVGSSALFNCANNLCTNANFTINSTTLAPFLSNNEVAIDVALFTRNNCPSLTTKLVVVPEPVVTSVRLSANATSAALMPVAGSTRACFDQPYVLTLMGSNFVTQTIVEMRHSSGSIVTFSPNANVVVTSNKITIAFDARALPVGTHKIVVRNGGNCDSSATANELVIEPIVGVITTEPRALPSTLTTFAVRTSGVARSGATVSFSGAAAGDLVPDQTTDPSLLKVAFATAPAAGNYSFTVKTDAGCIGTGVSVLEVLSTASRVSTVTLDQQFFNAGELVVRSPNVTFSPGARVFLKDGNTLLETQYTYVLENGAALRTFRTAFSANKALELIFVDPANRRWGSTSLSVTGYSGSADIVVPGTVAKSVATAMQTVTVRTSDPTIAVVSCTLLCSSISNVARTQTCMSMGAPINSGQGGLVTVQFDRSTLVEGEVCRVRLTTASADVTSQRFAVIPEGPVGDSHIVLQPAALKTARSGACAAAVDTVPRFGARARTYVHVMGGRNAASTTLKTVEVALVSSTNIQLDFSQSADLVTAVAGCSAASINGSVYAIGGLAGANLLVQRARILNANDAPLLDTFVSYESGGGLTAGMYTYAVSYLTNADGESLPSNIVDAFVPATQSASVRLNAALPASVTSVTGWRLFRSKDGSTLQLLTTSTSTTSVSFTDSGAFMPTANVQPLAPGALGKWSTVTQTVPNSLGGVAFTLGGLEPAIIYAGGSLTPQNLTLISPAGDVDTGTNPLPFALPNPSFVRLADGVDSMSGFETEVWSLVNSAAVLSAFPQPDPSFSTRNQTQTLFMAGACGAAAPGKVVFVGGGADKPLRVGTYARSTMANDTAFADMGALANVPTKAPVHQSPACARVAGKLLVLGGLDANGVATSAVTTIVI